MDCTFISWCSLEAQAQAAWAQAVLSVLALLGAIAVPTHLHYKEAKQRAIDRKAKQKSMALAVLNELVPIEADLGAYIEQWSQDLREHLDSTEFKDLTTVPPTLTAIAQDLHDLGMRLKRFRNDASSHDRQQAVEGVG